LSKAATRLWDTREAPFGLGFKRPRTAVRLLIREPRLAMNAEKPTEHDIITLKEY
jgi:hypothetical protein